MAYIIVGLGNPGDEYQETRHNTGRIIVEEIARRNECNDFTFDKKTSSQKTKLSIAKSDAILLLPDTFMNKSGSAFKPLIGSIKAAEKVIVICDDLDLPLGSIRISFDRGSGGHKGIESIEKSLKTRKFNRVRVGISPQTAKGKIKKPVGEEKVVKAILGKFKPDEMKELKKLSKKIEEAILMLIEEGRPKAMSLYNN